MGLTTRCREDLWFECHVSFLVCLGSIGPLYRFFLMRYYRYALMLVDCVLSQSRGDFAIGDLSDTLFHVLCEIWYLLICTRIDMLW